MAYTLAQKGLSSSIGVAEIIFQEGYQPNTFFVLKANSLTGGTV
jgi:hypothetical protein